jgi:hypothetical protein
MNFLLGNEKGGDKKDKFHMSHKTYLFIAQA